MKSIDINERIIKKLRSSCEDNQQLYEFLTELAFLENENPGWYADKYKKLIEQYIKSWSE